MKTTATVTNAAAPARARDTTRKADPKSKGASRSHGTQVSRDTWDDTLCLSVYVTAHGEKVHLKYECVEQYTPFRLEIPTGSVKAFIWCKKCGYDNARYAAVHESLKKKFGPECADQAVHGLRYPARPDDT